MRANVLIAVFLLSALPAHPPGAVARAAAATTCRPTLPDPSTKPPASIDPSIRPSNQNWLWYGNQYLWTQLPPDGIYHDKRVAEIKVPWWRLVPGQLAIHGHPVGASKPHLTAYIPYGYGDLDFQPAGLVFPKHGCWRVTAKIQDHSLSFVVRVRA